MSKDIDIVDPQTFLVKNHINMSNKSNETIIISEHELRKIQHEDPRQSVKESNFSFYDMKVSAIAVDNNYDPAANPSQSNMDDLQADSRKDSQRTSAFNSNTVPP